jgi:hypothetical protein
MIADPIGASARLENPVVTYGSVVAIQTDPILVRARLPRPIAVPSVVYQYPKVGGDDYAGVFLCRTGAKEVEDVTNITSYGFQVTKEEASSGGTRVYVYAKLSTITNYLRYIHRPLQDLPASFWQLPEGEDLTDDLILRGPQVEMEVFLR